MKINPKICLSFIALNSYGCVSQAESSIARSNEDAQVIALVIPEESEREESNRENFFQEENAREFALYGQEINDEAEWEEDNRELSQGRYPGPFFKVSTERTPEDRSPVTRLSTAKPPSSMSPATRLSTMRSPSSLSPATGLSTVHSAPTEKSPSTRFSTQSTESSLSASENFVEFVLSGIDPESRLLSSLDDFPLEGFPDFIDVLIEQKGSEHLDWPNFFKSIGLPADTEITRFSHMIRELNRVAFGSETTHVEAVDILNGAVDRGDFAFIREYFYEYNEQVRIDEVDRESIFDSDSESTKESSGENSSSQITLGLLLGLGLIAWL